MGTENMVNEEKLSSVVNIDEKVNQKSMVTLAKCGE